MELLRGIGDGEMPDFTGKRVVVIGGGNVAMDVTRSAIRLGADRVTCVYRRRKEDMTALPEEVEGAEAEGAELLTLHAPVRIESDGDGNAVALWTQPQIIGEMDRQGRPKPGTARAAERRVEADIIIVAIGQGIESDAFDQSLWPARRGRAVAQHGLQAGPRGLSAGTPWKLRPTRSPPAAASCVPVPGLSGLLRTLLDAQGLVRIDADLEGLEQGSVVDVLLL